MIPKVIHYCWFGRGEKSKLIQKCIKSWLRFCPDYEIVEWNEDNFDVNSTIWTKQAYEAKKWAFVADYVRLYALYNYGGIYCDTDVELIKSLDGLLKDKGFSGFEDAPILVQTGILGTEKGFDLFESLLSYYDNRHFIRSDGSYDTTTNTHITTDILEKHGLISNGKMQNVNGFVVYPKDYFAPKDFYTGKIEKTKNTVCIHHYDLSWAGTEGKKYWEVIRAKNRLKQKKDFILHIPNLLLMKIIGNDNYTKIKKFVKGKED